jgi:hypothetical protein
VRGIRGRCGRALLFFVLALAVTLNGRGWGGGWISLSDAAAEVKKLKKKKEWSHTRGGRKEKPPTTLFAMWPALARGRKRSVTKRFYFHPWLLVLFVK